MIELNTPEERMNTLKRDIYRLSKRIATNDFIDAAASKRAKNTISDLQGQLAKLERNFKVES